MAKTAAIRHVQSNEVGDLEVIEVLSEALWQVFIFSFFLMLEFHCKIF